MRELHDLHQWVEAREGKANQQKVWDCIEQELQNPSLTLQPQPASTPTPTEPFVEVIHQYTNTLCSTQKQMSLINSLLQDITVFNEYDLTWLEEWLMDIETAADLINESGAKLAKAKSRTGSYIGHRSNELWKVLEQIKDLLRLKLCNTYIHTYTSHFMDSQQQEKESLAVYIHQFKTEAKWCSFTNDAVTIRIFVKGLKNAHSLATHIYKKAPETLTDAILEVENSVPHSSSQQQSSHSQLLT